MGHRVLRHINPQFSLTNNCNFRYFKKASHQGRQCDLTKNHTENSLSHMIFKKTDVKKWFMDIVQLKTNSSLYQDIKKLKYSGWLLD